MSALPDRDQILQRSEMTRCASYGPDYARSIGAGGILGFRMLFVWPCLSEALRTFGLQHG
jgi:hypothetical protein